MKESFTRNLRNKNEKGDDVDINLVGNVLVFVEEQSNAMGVGAVHIVYVMLLSASWKIQRLVVTPVVLAVAFIEVFMIQFLQL